MAGKKNEIEVNQECIHRWLTRSQDDFCYCMYCMLEFDEWDAKERKKWVDSLAKRVKRVRTNLKLSQQKFANLLGIDSARTVRYYEAGERELPIWVSKKIKELENNDR